MSHKFKLTTINAISEKCAFCMFYRMLKFAAFHVVNCTINCTAWCQPPPTSDFLERFILNPCAVRELSRWIKYQSSSRNCARNLASSSWSTPPLLIENTFILLTGASTWMPCYIQNLHPTIPAGQRHPANLWSDTIPSANGAKLLCDSSSQSSSCRCSHRRDIKFQMTGAWLCLWRSQMCFVCMGEMIRGRWFVSSYQNQRFPKRRLHRREMSKVIYVEVA